MPGVSAVNDLCGLVYSTEVRFIPEKGAEMLIHGVLHIYVSEMSFSLLVTQQPPVDGLASWCVWWGTGGVGGGCITLPAEPSAPLNALCGV